MASFFYSELVGTDSKPCNIHLVSLHSERFIQDVPKPILLNISLDHANSKRNILFGYSVYGLNYIKARVINMHDKVLNGSPIFMGVEYKTLNLLIVILCAKLHQRCPYSLKTR